jgi:membrane-associated protease RseP (regulator of RpoE activity)
VKGIGILIFIASVLLAIGIHELGHFATAKWFKIKVDKFFIGFGPRLWSTKRGETEYGLSAFPIGGYVKIAGMNPLEEVPPEDQPRTFKSKPAWQRAIVLVAGSVTHFIVAIIILTCIFTLVGETDIDTPTLVIGAVGSEELEQKTPAEVAGVRPGDRVIEIAGQRVTSWSQVQQAIRTRPNQPIEIAVERDGRPLILRATLGERDRDGETIGFLGVSPEFAQIDRSPGEAVVEATKDVGVGIKDSFLAFGKIFTPSTLSRLFQVATGQEERRPEDPASIVGIGRSAGDLAGERDFAQLFFMIAGFNVFIGMANLLPLPPLDGGHLAVLGFEKLTGRDVDMRRLIPITAMVLTAFGLLFVLVLSADLFNPLKLPG